MKIPVLDLDLEDENAQASRVWGMLRDESYFLVTGQAVSALPLPELLRSSKSFFDLPLDEKLLSYIGKSAVHRGYVPLGEEGEDDDAPEDLKEGFDSGLENLDVTFQQLAAPQEESGWPTIPGFRDSLENYQRAIAEVASRVARLVSIAIGLEPDYLSSRAKNPPNQLRLLRYPGSEFSAQGVGMHTDFECLTLLATTSSGLEVKQRGEEWIRVPYMRDSLVVTTGDLLETITNGALPAAPHRVGWVREERFSFPYFFSLDADEIVEPLPKFISDGRVHYPPVGVRAHLMRRTTEVFRYLRRLDEPPVDFEAEE